MEPVGARHDDVRRRNLSALLRQVHLSGPLSRADLTTRLGLNRSTVGVLVGDLVTACLVEEAPPASRSGAGRPSLVVAPLPDYAWVLCVDLRVDTVVVARVGLGGALLDRRSRSGLVLSGMTPQATVELVEELTADLQEGVPPGARLVGIGVAMPGVVRREDGFVQLAPNLGWSQVAFGDLLLDRLDLRVPLAVANDADLGALAEHTRGVAVGLDEVVFLAGNIGLGAGIITGGRPLLGAAGYAGEFGHMLVNPDGRRCRCGARGCWEAEVGEAALLARAGLRPGTGAVGVARVLADARDGRPRALAATRETARWVGLGLASVVNVLNPQMVVIGGLLREVYAVQGAVVRREVRRNALAAPHRDLRLVLPAHQGDSTLVGAAELAFAPLLHDPLGVLRGGPAGRTGRAGCEAVES